MDNIVEQEKIVENQEELEINENQNEESVYPMDGIKVDKGFYTVYELKRRYDGKNKRIILDSDFQRENVWKIDRQSELIESVLMGLPLPIFYFNQDRYGRLIVVDGRQRLTALFEYMNDQYALKNLKILPQFNNKKFSQLLPIYQTRIEDYQIQAHVILPPTPDRIKFDIFDRVNRGGMQLNKQEIRNALYQGKATKLLNQITESVEFTEATGDAFVKETRMKDKYLITRFMTFFLFYCGRITDNTGEKYQYRGDIDDFLGRGMDTINGMQDHEIENLMTVTLNALENSYYYFGKDGFRLVRDGKRSPINMNVFETIMFIMLWIKKINPQTKNKVREYVLNFITGTEFRENIGNHRDSAAKLQWRLNEANRIGSIVANL